MGAMTKALAYAAATDAGNRSMRKSGRTAWNEEDYDAAVKACNQAWPMRFNGVPVDAGRYGTLEEQFGPGRQREYDL
jgi:hypothetical protein